MKLKLLEIEEVDIFRPSRLEDKINLDSFPPEEREFYEYQEEQRRKGRNQNEEYRNY